LRSSVPSGRASQKPPRSATTKPPRLRRVKQPIDSGIGIATLRPVAGSNRFSDGALMSTQ
jgi:hypothetical protein